MPPSTAPRPADPVPPVPVRPAATVLYVRDGRAAEGDLEVCLLRRNLESAFVGGAYVFPGGGVDPADADPAMAALCDGRSPEDASRALGLPLGGLAFWIAAIRESFEEAGLLPARWAVDGAPLRLDEPAVAERFAAHRRAVDAGERSLAEVLQAEGLRLELSAVQYVARWITPEGPVRRYDTRFFLAEAPPHQPLEHDNREVIAAHWLAPHAALEQHAAGALTMLPPTVACLQELRASGSVAEALAQARRRLWTTP